MECDPDIFDAVEFGDLESVKMYWTKDINIDYQDTNGMSLIMLASKFNNKEIINFLLTRSPNLHLRNKENETVFQIAESLGDREIYKRLVDYCWKENERMFIFEYHVKPNFESEFSGAYTNSWILDTDFNSAKERSKELIKNENWSIMSIEDIREIKKGDFTESDDKFKYYEQSIIEKEVLVIYVYE